MNGQERQQQANLPNNTGNQGSNNLNAPGYTPPYFPMSDYEVGSDTGEASDVGFDDNSGSIQLNFLERLRAKPVDQRVVDESAQQQARETQTNVYEDRFKQLEGTILQQPQAMQQMVAIMAGFMQGQTPQQGQAQEPEYDLSDAGQLTQFMERKINNAITAALKPVLDVLPQMASRISQFDAASKYGKEYADMLPQIQQLIQAAPGMSYEQAFQIVSGIRKGATPAETPKETNKPQGTAEQLLKLAQSVQTERGVNPGLRGKPEVRTLRDAMNAAKMELFGH